MGFPYHTITAPNGLNGFAQADRIIMGYISVTYAAGGSAGTAVTTPVVIGSVELPSTYSVFVGAAADVTAYITAQTGAGFTLNVEPRLAANTVAAGSVGLLIVA